MKRKLKKYFQFFPLFFFPIAAFAQTDISQITTRIEKLKTTFNTFVMPLLFTLASVIFIWGIIQYIAQSDDEGARKKAKQLMLWGIIGLAVITAVWSVVTIIITYFGVGGVGIPEATP